MELNHTNVENSKIEFLILPLRIVYGENLIPEDVKVKFKGSIPYDYYLPSIKEEVIVKRCCVLCGKYHTTLKSLKNHEKECKKSRGGAKNYIEDCDDSDNSIIEEIEDDCDPLLVELENVRPVFSAVVTDQFVETVLDLREWMKIPWIAEEDKK